MIRYRRQTRRQPAETRTVAVWPSWDYGSPLAWKRKSDGAERVLTHMGANPYATPAESFTDWRDGEWLLRQAERVTNVSTLGIAWVVRKWRARG